MRLTGLASGLDIDSMVTELMKARRTTYDNMVKKRTKAEWQQEDYRELSTKIVDFRNNKLASYSLSSAISAKSSEVSGNTDTLTVNSTSSTAAGSLTVNVTQLATAENEIYTFTAAEMTQDLETLGFTEDSSNTSNVLVTINSKTVSIAKTASLSDLATAINAKSSTVKATALYDSTTGQFSITATQTGAGKLDLTDSVFTSRTPVATGGDNAQVTINGISYEQASNRFSVNGFDFTVKAESGAVGTTTITAVQDTDKIIETIKSFVTEYNSLISSVNSELSETKNRDYAPLTDDEKEEMTEDQIEIWETKAKSGALRNDTTLNRMISDLRLAATSLVSGIEDANGDTISIGITTGSYTEKGKLVLDEEQLRSALDSNPDEVISLFTATSSDTSASSTTAGVFAKIKASTMTALKSLAEKAGTSLTSTDTSTSFLENSLLSTQITQMKSRESAMLDRLDAMEDNYYKIFSTMETAINKYNSQSSSLSSFLS